MPHDCLCSMFGTDMVDLVLKLHQRASRSGGIGWLATSQGSTWTVESIGVTSKGMGITTRTKGVKFDPPPDNMQCWSAPHHKSLASDLSFEFRTNFFFYSLRRKLTNSL